MTEPFHGTKLAILADDRIVTILRDDNPSIPWPSYWDLPGGGREASESPEACILRELREELGLDWRMSDLHWSMRSQSQSGFVWFFVSEAPKFDANQVVFGDEGQEWRLAPLSWYLNEAKTIPHQRDRLMRYLKGRRR